VRANFYTFFLALILLGCGGGPEQKTDYVYITAPQVALRDRVAAVYNKVGFVANGEKVQVLDRSGNKRFLKIRTTDNREGWIEVRYTTTQDVYDAFAKLARDHTSSDSQATAVVRRVLNMHVQPARDSDALFQLKEGDKLQLLERSSTPRTGLKGLQQQRAAEKAEEKEKDDVEDKAKAAESEEPRNDTPATVPLKSGKPAKPVKGKLTQSAIPAVPMEDWWLVRDEHKRVGWVLGRMIDVEIPLEIAQYAEGERVVAAFVINEVTDEVEGVEKKVPQYAVLLSEPKDGMPFDYNQLRIFTWNSKKDRYETAFRDRFEGKLPFKITKEDFGKEGTLPVFTALALTNDGATEKKYKMNGVIVRRLTPAGATEPSANRVRKPVAKSAKKR
jgi:uncharacterized protein YgiM (DUF1202 family)